MASLAMQEWGTLVRKLGVLRSSGPSLRTAVSVEFLIIRNGIRVEGLFIADVQSELEIPHFLISGGKQDSIKMLTYVQWFEVGGQIKQLRRLKTVWPHVFSQGKWDFTQDPKKVLFYLPEDFLTDGHVDESRLTRPFQMFESLGSLSPRFTHTFVWAARSLRLKSRARQITTRDRLSRSGLPHSRPINEDVTQTWSYRQYYQIGSSIIINATGSVVIPWVTYRNRTRTNTPNFFRLRKSERPINPYSLTEIITRPRMGYQRCFHSASDSEYFWAAPCEWAVVLPGGDFGSPSEAENRAFARLIDEMGNEPFGLAQDLVQHRQTTDLITSNLTRIAKAYRAVRNRQFKVAVKELFDNRPPRYRKGAKEPSWSQNAASNWLELQYGWKPLLSDIDILIRKVHINFRDYLRVARSSAKTSTTSSTAVSGPFNVSIQGVSPYTCGYINRKLDIKVKYGIRYRLTNKDRQFLAQAGFTNPINLAWELLPYSFVVDWIYPLGPYLERLSAFEGLTFQDGYKSTFRRESTTVVLSDSRTVNGWDLSISFGTERDYVYFTREKLTTFPRVPSIALKSPISVTHALNALALVRTAFGDGANTQKRFRN